MISQSKYCRIRYVKYKDLSVVKQILESIFEFPRKQQISFQQQSFTKEDAGIYSNGMRIVKYSNDNKYHIEIIEMFQEELGYQFKESICESDPHYFLEQIGYAKQKMSLYQMKAELWKNQRFQLFVYFYPISQFMEIRQYSNKPFQQFNKLAEKIIIKLSNNVEPVPSPSSQQYFRPDIITIPVEQK